ncbi:MAG: 23S rRNA (uracil(1939)-C(5))-methyltransferase RlmD, partial [Gammaproteobacteria bacterium]|nr:23S rRNA (uracil(1939)-C(5))-methyltransferase RlmD [Gammaproteobacteria bacterium]
MDLTANQSQARRLRRGDQATVEIESLTQEGRGVARHNGKVLFVADALPGESVLATVVKTRRRHDMASTSEIHVASPQRVTPRCEWFGNCGGCSLQHLDSSAQLDFKQDWLLDALQR